MVVFAIPPLDTEMTSPEKGSQAAELGRAGASLDSRRVKLSTCSREAGYAQPEKCVNKEGRKAQPAEAQLCPTELPVHCGVVNKPL